MDADKHGGVEKCGYVQKLSESGFPYITQWKKRYIVLSKGKLFIYEKSDSKGSQKNSEAIDLKYFNHIVEADEKDAKKVPNVFLITSNERTFFDSGRITLAADSKEEMQHWIESLMKSLEFIKNNSNPNKVYVFQGSLGKTTNPSNEPVITKFEEVRPVTTDARDSLNFSPFSNKEFHSQPDNKPENGLPGGIETKPLNNITRSRAKGPAGRRAPRNRHTMQARPSSLILLNPKEEHEDNQRSKKILGLNEKRGRKLNNESYPCLVYFYSDDEESSDEDISSGMKSLPSMVLNSNHSQRSSVHFPEDFSVINGQSSPFEPGDTLLFAEDERINYNSLGRSIGRVSGRSSPAMDALDDLLMNQSIQQVELVEEQTSDTNESDSNTFTVNTNQEAEDAMSSSTPRCFEDPAFEDFTSNLKYLQRHVASIDIRTTKLEQTPKLVVDVASELDIIKNEVQSLSAKVNFYSTEFTKVKHDLAENIKVIF